MVERSDTTGLRRTNTNPTPQGSRNSAVPQDSAWRISATPAGSGFLALFGFPGHRFARPRANLFDPLGVQKSERRLPDRRQVEHEAGEFGVARHGRRFFDTLGDAAGAVNIDTAVLRIDQPAEPSAVPHVLLRLLL